MRFFLYFFNRIGALLAVLLIGSFFINPTNAYSRDAGSWVYPGNFNQWESTNGGISTSLSFADINCDSHKEIIFGTKNGAIYALKNNGREAAVIQVAESIKTGPLLMDINRDGCTDLIVFGRQAGYDDPAKKSIMAVIDGKTSKKVSEIELNGSVVSRPGACDFNNDGNVDFLIPARGLYIVDGTFDEDSKAVVYGYEVDGITYSSPSIDDLNDDAIYDFFIPFTSKGIPYIDVFLSTGSYFKYEKLKFSLKREIRLMPSIIKTENETIQKWLLTAPNTYKKIDFYNLIWDVETHSLSFTYLNTFNKYRKKYTQSVPILKRQDATPVLPIYLDDRGTLTIIDVVSQDVLSTLDVGTNNENITVYTEQPGDGRLYKNFILGAANDTLFKIDIEQNAMLELLSFKNPPPPLSKLFLMPYKGKKQKGYTVVGLTKKNRIYYNKTVIDLPLKDPNEIGYLNQGVFPLSEIDELINAIASSSDWRNLTGMDLFLSLAKQLYPEDSSFINAVKEHERARKKNLKIFSDIMALKSSIRQKAASNYDYLTLINWSWSGDLERSIDKILKTDKEFIEEKDIGAFYHKLISTKSLIRMSLIFIVVLGTLTLLALFILNFRNIMQAIIIVLFYFGVNREWKKVIETYPDEGALTERLNETGFLAKSLTPLFEYKLKVLLLMLLKRNSFEWNYVLNSYRENMAAINKTVRMDKRLHKFLLRNYIMLYRKRASTTSPLGWLSFRIKHLFMEDYNNYKTQDTVLLTIRFEIIKVFFALDDVRQAFNNLHKLYKDVSVIENYEYSPVPVYQPLSILNSVNQGKIEKYFFKYSKDFFKIVTSSEDRFSILSSYKCMDLKPRVDESINIVLKESTRLFELPTIVINHYLPSSPLIDQGLYYTLYAYNRLKGEQVVLRCIPDKNNFINLSNDRKLTTLYNNNPTIARIYNNHRNKIWNIQVESFIKHKSLSQLSSQGLALPEIKEIMLSLIGLIEKNLPLWFIPSLHPMHLFWDGKIIYLSATGLNKLEIDRHIVMNYSKQWQKRNVDFFMTPEFYKNPEVKKAVSNKYAIEGTIVYLLGLLLHWLIEEKFPYSFEDLPEESRQIEAVRFAPAKDIIKQALSYSPNDRPKLASLKESITKVDWT